MNDNLHALVGFSITDLIGSKRFNKIIQHFQDPSIFLDCDLDSQMNFLELTSDSARLRLKNIKKQTEIVLAKCEKQNIRIISYDDPLYPPLLKDIDDPPYVLYVKGHINPTIPLISVIGTRKSTYDAEQVNKWFCQHFVKYGIGVVSGLAHGHDAIASSTALEQEGYAVGILGTAIDVVYPSNSKKLYDSMIEKGAIISEYPPGITSTKWRFPRRNRIVSGISQSVFVVQAPIKSGTMITVKMAISQGKEVYAVPGNPMNPQNKGSNFLIQNGAKLALHPEEIIQDILKSNPNIETMNFVSSHQKITQSQDKDVIDPSLSTHEKKILSLLKSQHHIDEISHSLEINISSLNALLTMMEIKGLVVQRPGQIYVRGTS